MLIAFDDCIPLSRRVLFVLQTLPEEVQEDFTEDPRFRITIEDYVPGRGTRVHMEAPGPIGADSRCIVLRRRLNDCEEAFAHYVIAHELAHAYLRHGGWQGIDDHEAAADALAAHWGFPRPRTWPAWR